MPSPTPTDEDINFVREVAGERDALYVGSLIDDLNDAEWGRALDLIDEWNKVTPGDLVALRGGRDGVWLSDHEGLDDIRRRMRLLLGLPEFRVDENAAISRTVLTQWRW